MTTTVEQGWAGGRRRAATNLSMTPSSAGPPNLRLLWLDAVRGVAALAVAILHAAYMFHLSYSPVHAYLAVDLFFLLSGYVLAASYDAQLSVPGAWRSFMAGRLRRLYPMVIVGILLGAAVMFIRAMIAHDVRVSHLLIYAPFGLFLLPVPTELGLPQSGFIVNPVFWSILFELVANLLYGLIAPRLQNRRLWALVAVSAAAWKAVTLSHGSIDCGLTEPLLGIPRVLVGFFLGVALRRRFPPRRLSGAIKRQSLAGCGLMAVIALVLLAPVAKDAAYDALCVFVLFPAVVVIGASLDCQPALRPLWRLSGELSYPTYAISHPVCRALANAASLAHLPPSLSTTGLVSSIAISVMSAYATWRLVDLPLRRRLRGATRPEPAASAP